MGLSPIGKAPTKAYAADDGERFHNTIKLDGTNNYYDTLAEAVAAAKSGDKLVLVKDSTVSVAATNSDAIKVPAGVNIDLAGNKLVITSGTGSDLANNNAALTFAGKSTISGGAIDISKLTKTAPISVGEDADVTLSGTVASDGAAVAVTDNGKLTTTAEYTVTTAHANAAITVDNATFEMAAGKVAVTTAAGGSGASALNANAAAVVTLGEKDAGAVPSLSSDKAAAIVVDDDDSSVGQAGFVINSGDLKSTEGVAVDLQKAVKLTINDGAFYGANNALKTAENENITLTINGGTFDYKSSANPKVLATDAAALDLAADNTYSITGGTIKGNAFKTIGNAEGSVTGGTFNTKLTAEDALAEGASIVEVKKATETAFGEYVVRKAMDSIDDSGVTVENADGKGLVYTGAAQKPVVTVKDGTKELKEGDDYTLTLYAGAKSNYATESALENATPIADGTVLNGGKYTYKITASEKSTAYAGYKLAEFDVAAVALQTLFDDPEDETLKVEMRVASGAAWVDIDKFAGVAIPAEADVSKDPDTLGKVTMKGEPWSAAPQVQVTYNGNVIYFSNATSGNLLTQNAVSGADTVSDTSANDSADWKRAKITLAPNAANTSNFGNLEFSFSVLGKDISGATLTKAIDSKLTYSGADQKATALELGTLAPKLGAYTFENDDVTYTVLYKGLDGTDTNREPVAFDTAEVKNAGSYQLIATGASTPEHPYSGTKAFDFKVAPFTIDTVLWQDATVYYTGTPIATVKQIVGADGEALTPNDGETNVVEPATATHGDANGKVSVTVKGVNNYAGELTGSFTIVQGQFTSATAANLEYNGQVQDVVFAFKDGNDVVNPSADDYKATFEKKSGTSWVAAEPKDAGQYRATVEGQNGYKGKVENIEFSIVEKDISTAANITVAFTDAAKDILFAGEPINPNDYIDWTKSTIQMAAGTPVLPLAKGDITIKTTDGKETVTTTGAFTSFDIYGNGNLKGSVASSTTSTVTIVGSLSVGNANLAKAAEIQSAEGATFTGEAQEPAVKVVNKITGKELVRGTDFDVTYTWLKDGDGEEIPADTTKTMTEVTHAGTYSVTVTATAGGLYDDSTSTKLVYDGTIEVAQVALSDLTDWDVKPEAATTLDPKSYIAVAQEPAIAATTAKLGKVEIDLSQDETAKGGNLTFDGEMKAAKTYDKLVLKGKGDFKGTLETNWSFKIEKAEFDTKDNKLAIQFDNGNDIYTDSYVGVLKDGKCEPGVRVVYTYQDAKADDPALTSVLEQGVDYTVVYTDQKKTGKATVTIKIGTGKDSNVAYNDGQADPLQEATYSIAANDLANATVTFVNAAPATYNGVATDMVPVVEYNDNGTKTTLKVGVDYTVYLKKASDEADAPAVKIYDDSKDEWVVDEEGNALNSIKDADAYTFVIAAKDNSGDDTYTYGGQVKKEVEIKALDLSTAKLNPAVVEATDGQEIGKIVYTGEAIELDTSVVTSGNALLQFDAAPAANIDIEKIGTPKYTSNVSAGKASVEFGLAEKDTNYAGSFTYEFDIDKADISADRYGDSIIEIHSADIKGDGTQVKYYYGEKDGYEFTGSQLMPAIQIVKADTDAANVKVGYDKPLDLSQFKVTYGTNVDVIDGIYVAINPVEGGNYTGVLYTNFKINPVAFNESNVTVTAPADAKYTGDAVTGVTAKYKDYTLQAGKDYKVDYANNVNVGDATATLTALMGIPTVGSGNFYSTEANDEANSIVKTFKITKADQDFTVPATLSVKVGDKAKIDVKGAVGAVTFTAAAGGLVTVGTDGTVTGVKAGTTSVTVKALGDGNHNELTKTVAVTVTAKATPAPAAKKANTMKVSVAKGAKKKAAVKVKVAKKATIKSAVTVKAAKGKVTVNNVSKNKMTKTYKVKYKAGKINILVPKGKVQKGITRQVKIQVKAAGNANFKPMTKTVNVYVKGVK